MKGEMWKSDEDKEQPEGKEITDCPWENEFEKEAFLSVQITSYCNSVTFREMRNLASSKCVTFMSKKEENEKSHTSVAAAGLKNSSERQGEAESEV